MSIEKSRDIVWQITPAQGLHDRWRDATPIGNGLTGMLQYGGIASDEWIINRHDLWFGGSEPTSIPDVSGSLAQMRRLMEQGRFQDACEIMCKALADAGYHTSQAQMRPLAGIALRCDCPGTYSDYTRAIHMDTGEADICYRINGQPYRRRSFVSRAQDIIVGRQQTPVPADLSFRPDFHQSDDRSAAEAAARQDRAGLVRGSDGVCCHYSTQNTDGTFFGVVCRVISDGTVTVTDDGISVVGATDTLLLVKAFSAEPCRASALAQAIAQLSAVPFDYDALLNAHLARYQPLYRSADLRLYNGTRFHSNEELLAAAKSQALSAELAEKLWRFGRYLFIGGTNEEGSPFPLYGLWAPEYSLPWPQNVGNENVEIIHWHAVVGGLPMLLKPLIRYYSDKTDVSREAAQKLFGCRGIFVSTYTTPVNSAPSPCVPVIIHFMGTAGWLARHFYEYCLMTGDEELLQTRILPFMMEAARFYEDYVIYDPDGRLRIYPSVSPENSPLEFRDSEHPTASGHPMPVTMDATIEIAIMKDLLRHLIALSENHPIDGERVAVWRKMLDAAPDYRINSDGAIAEWIDPQHSDEYCHRHISQVYPAFPGDEILDDHPELLPAFRKAVRLRRLGYLTGWALAHYACIYARLNDAQSAFGALNQMVKVCLLPNFFTMHNDYRGMGITTDRMGDATFAPVQLDAICGSVNAIQEMLLTVTPKHVVLLPALPEQFRRGSFANMHFFGGTLSLRWDARVASFRLIIKAARDCNVSLTLPFGAGTRDVTLHKGERLVING